MAIYKERYLESTIKLVSGKFPIVLLTGARQVGKTTLLKHLSQNRGNKKRQYISLDEFELRSLAKNDPARFLEQYPAPLIIDEIQHAPELFPYLKAKVDRERRMGAYWLSGSQQFHLMKNVSESLAGRVAVLKLLGLSLAEEKGNIPIQNPWAPDYVFSKSITLPPPSLSLTRLFEKIVRGSFPRLISRNPPPWENFYGSYVQTYIDRDLRDLVKVVSLSRFERFIKACAARTAGMLNFSDMARDSDISVNTAKEWLSLLEASGHVFLLQPYYRNLTKRLIKTPKLYFLDTGLVCYLTGWLSASTALRGAFAGQLFETFVIGEIIKSYWHRGLEPRIYYFRTKEKYEVDLIMEKNGKLLAAEIKLASRLQMNDIKGMQQFKTLQAGGWKGVVIAPVKTPYPLAKDIFVVSPEIIN